jgi:hypothetical protein
MNYANPQEHVPEAERNNRVIKERVRASYHRLPYTHLPRLMIKMLVTESAKKLNFFPTKNGVSSYYSPRMILHQRSLDYNCHCHHALGTYVQAHEEPQFSNTNAARSLDCVYLRYNDDFQGGHELLHLPTNSLITRRVVTPVPITPSVIQQVHALAEQEGMPKGLKISNRTGRIFYDTAWIAGVDYADDGNKEDEDAEEDEEDELTSNEHDDDPDPDEFTVSDKKPDEVDEESEIDQEVASDDDEGNQEEVLPSDEDELLEEESNPSSADDQDKDVRTTRSGRVSRPPVKLTMSQIASKEEQYSIDSAKVIATTMCCINELLLNPDSKRALQFAQTYS